MGVWNAGWGGSISQGSGVTPRDVQTGGEGTQAVGRAAEALGEPKGWTDRGRESSVATSGASQGQAWN